MNGLKSFLSDFPNQNGTVVTALILILLTGLVVVVRLAFGRTFPENYDTWIWALVALAGVNVVGMVGKRATDISYVAAKNTGPAVNVAAPSTVTVTPVQADVAPAVLTKEDADRAARALEENQKLNRGEAG